MSKTCWAEVQILMVSGCFSEYLRLKGTLMLDANREESVNHFLSSEDRNQNPLMAPSLQAAASTALMKFKKRKSSASPHGYLLHRAPTAFVPCASSPSSSSAPAASPSWRLRGSSPRTPAAGRSGGCTGTGLVGTETLKISHSFNILSICKRCFF